MEKTQFAILGLAVARFGQQPLELLALGFELGDLVGQAGNELRVGVCVDLDFSGVETRRGQRPLVGEGGVDQLGRQGLGRQGLGRQGHCGGPATRGPTLVRVGVRSPMLWFGEFFSHDRASFVRGLLQLATDG